MSGFSKATIVMERVGLDTGDGFKKVAFDIHFNFGENVSDYAKTTSLKEFIYTSRYFNDILNLFKESASFFYVEATINEIKYKFFVAGGCAFSKVKLSENVNENLYRQIEFTDIGIAAVLKKEELRGLEYYINLKEKKEYEFERDLCDWK